MRNPRRVFARRNCALAVALLFGALLFALAVGASRAYAATEDFALLADTHLGQPGEAVYKEAEHALRWAVKFPNLKAVCVAGDLTDRGSAKSYDEWAFLCGNILQGAAHIQALGDHDTGKSGEYLHANPLLTVANGYSNFLKINGGSVTSYHEFEHANVMTVGGSTASGHCSLPSSMLKTLNGRLKRTARQGKVALVICHYPYNSYSLASRSKLMGVLRSYPNVIYVSGHLHRYSPDAQCRIARPSCTTTPYARAGFARGTEYSFKSIGVNACSSYRSNSYSYANSLSIGDDGAISLKKWNLSNDTVARSWSFRQAKSSIAVKAKPSKKKYPRSAKLTYSITFSDGKAYGGVSSGSTFTLAAGGVKTFGNIPAGVLVSVKLVDAPKGWKKSKTYRMEVGKSKRIVRVKTAYKAKKPKKGAKAKAKENPLAKNVQKKSKLQAARH